MLDIQNVHGILDIVRRIGANGESGQLEITSAGNRGILLFRKGKLVDATLGTLSGFQAVNAAVSLRDVQFSFNPLTAPTRPSAIAASERLVLKSFFGIEAADETQSSIDWNTTPHQVVPIEVDKVKQNLTPTLEATPNIETLVERVFVSKVSAPSSHAQLLSPSKLSPNSYTPEAQTTPRERRVFLPFAISLGLLLILAATAAIVLIPRLQARRELAAATPPAAEQAPTIPESTTSGVKQDSERKPDEKVREPQSTDLARQQSARGGSHTSSNAAAPGRAQSAQHEFDVQDLNGKWKVINTVEKSALKTYENLQVGFRLTIEQRGKDFTGRGEKVSENGRNLPARNRTPIRVTGSIEGDTVLANFTEDGTARRTNGRFTWRLQNENAALTGRFVSAAANSSGKSAATRE